MQETLTINDFWTQKNLIKDVRQVIDDTSCYICYPILENKEIRHPLFIIEAHLDHELFTIEQIHVNLGALMLFIASLNNQEKSETEDLQPKQQPSLSSLLEK